MRATPLLASWIALILVSVLSSTLSAQDAAAGPSYEGDDSPFASERAKAIYDLDIDDARMRVRAILKDGGNVGDLVDALELTGSRKDKADIPLIVPYITDVQPEIAAAALDALRAYGRLALETVNALPASAIDAPTRKEIKNQLLKDHVRACCTRDSAINRFLLDYEGREAELYSVKEEIDDLMMDMLRGVASEIRKDLSGMRYYYPYNQEENAFLQVGALAVYALSKHRKEQLKREFADIMEDADDFNQNYWGGYRQLTNVTLQLCYFFGGEGKKEALHRVISDLDGSLRWQQDPYSISMIHMQIAAIYFNGLKESNSALERVEQALGAKPDGGDISSFARYLRARIMMEQKDEGGALRELEMALESDSPPLLVAIDKAFAPLHKERRFGVLVRYCELTSRTLPENLRPWKAEP
ncbi:MAG: hypothetical protein IT462_00400 [Planctomycetes bacterium]|nr:hypothetical protein [Planctomycetota bacterium]